MLIGSLPANFFIQGEMHARTKMYKHVLYNNPQLGLNEGGIIL